VSRGLPCFLIASSLELSSWPRGEQRAYPIRMSALGRSGSIGAGGGVPGHHGRPGPRSAGVGFRCAFLCGGTLV
jgi:hypothetical protein